MKMLVRLWLMVVSVIVMIGCERRPLVDADGVTDLRVRIHTAGIPNVTTGIYNPALQPQQLNPEVMRLLIYDPSGEQLIAQAFTNERSDEEGITVLSRRVPMMEGDYRVLGYNFDLADTKVEGEQQAATLRAYTSEITQQLYARFGSRAEEFGTIYYEPEHLFVAQKPEVHIVSTSELQRVEMDAETVVDTYYIQIRIEGMEYLAEKANGLALLSGLAPSLYLADESCKEEPSAIYFELVKSTDERITEGTKNVLCAHFNTFGKMPDAASELRITLTVLARDGSRHEKVIDMTPIFATEDARERHWLLIDEVWSIPKPDNPDDGGGGFAPSVNDWDDIEEVIPIGR